MPQRVTAADGERGWAHVDGPIHAPQFRGWCANRDSRPYQPCGMPVRHISYDPTRQAIIRERIRAVDGG